MIGRVSSPRFVGRHEELHALEAAVESAAAGAGSVVLVSGEPGIGKSRLISEFAHRAQRWGATVAIGECPPLADGELPYAPIIGALRSWTRDHGTSVEAVFDATPRSGVATDDATDLEAGDLLPADSAQAQLFERLLRLLLETATDAPVVLVVEDIQWADRSTRAFLSFLVRAARPERLALVCSYRSDEVHSRQHPVRPFVHELGRSGQATRVDLAPFTRAELREQVSAILNAPPAPGLVGRLLERSEGNPFYAEELLASTQSGGELPESLRDALLWRFDGKPDAVRHVLRIAAVAGRAVDHGLLAIAAALPAEALTLALRDAVDSHLLTHATGSGDYSFRHMLVREAIYEDLLPGERRRLHAVLAAALSERNEPAAVAELAYHRYCAEELPQAVVASINAGRYAESVHALDEALLHYQRALAAWDGAGETELPLTRFEVTTRAADAARLTGRHDRAIELATEAVRLSDAVRDPTTAALAHARLAQTLWIGGGGEDAAWRETNRAVELMPAEPSHALAVVLAADAQFLLRRHQRDASTARCEEALNVAREVGALAVEAHVLNTSCANLSAIGDFDNAVIAAEQAREIARRNDLVEELGRSYINGSDALDHAGRVEAAIALAREGIEVSRRLGVERRLGDYLRSEIGGRLLRTARWDEAQALLEEVIDRGQTGFEGVIALERLAQLHADRGEFDRADTALARATDLLTRVRNSMWVGPIAAARATVALWRADAPSAATVIADCLQAVDPGEHLFYTARLYELGVRSCAEIAAGSPADAGLGVQQASVADALLARFGERIAELTVSVAPRVRATYAAASAERSRIGGHGDPRLWADAERLWDDCGDSYLAAYAQWRRAEAVLAADGGRADAGRLVRAAGRVAAELGAQPLALELDALARRARLDVARERDAHAAGPSPTAALRELELTDREIEVLTLVADGMTNREIAGRLYITEKTASAHVSHILSKLSVPNRTAAAALARQLGLGRVS